MNMMFQDGEFKLRGKMVDVAGMTLPVAEGYKVGVRGGYVTVDGAAVPGFPDRNIKIMVAGADSVVETEGSRAQDTRGCEGCYECSWLVR